MYNKFMGNKKVDKKATATKRDPEFIGRTVGERLTRETLEKILKLGKLYSDLERKNQKNNAFAN